MNKTLPVFLPGGIFLPGDHGTGWVLTYQLTINSNIDKSDNYDTVCGNSFNRSIIITYNLKTSTTVANSSTKYSVLIRTEGPYTTRYYGTSTPRSTGKSFSVAYECDVVVLDRFYRIMPWQTDHPAAYLYCCWVLSL